MTIANNFASKLAVAFVAVAMALTLMAPAAQAQSADELQAQIDSLLATIAALQAQLGGTTTGGSTTSCPALTAPMTIGSQGVNVTALQNYLIGAGHAIPAGATGYFGTQTQAAVSAWQAANGVSPTAGYWGPLSLAKYNMICTTDGDGDGDGDGDSSGPLSGGEASLEDFDSSDGEDTSLEEGQEEAEVAEFSFDVEDGDVEVNRIDVAFDAGTADEDEPWEAFDEVAIFVDGEEIASEDVSDEDDWSEDDPYTGSHVFRFTGLDWVVREDETAEFTVVVTVAGSLDGADDGEEWNVSIPHEGIRAEDGEGIQNYTGDTGGSAASLADVDDEVNFDIDEEGGDDELGVSISSEDPEATTLQLDSDDRSDWISIFAFDLDTDDSTNDIEINEIPVTLNFSSTTAAVGDVVNDLRLVVDGVEYDDYTVTTGTMATDDEIVVTFDLDGDLVIDAGDEVTVELEVEFKALSNAEFEGETIQATITSANADAIDAEGADDLTDDQTSGSATGETHTLRSSGVIVELSSTSETFKDNDDSTTTDNEGVFVIKFDVTAFEDDLYIENNAASGTTGTATGVTFLVENGSNVQLAGSDDSVLSSTATLDTTGSVDSFVVNEGETETFTLTVEFDPSASGFARVQLYGVNFATDASGTGVTQQRALPEEDFETDVLSI